VITSISIDHPKSLGYTIEKIAYEKAGIIKKGVPVVVGALPKKAIEVVISKAEQMKAPYYLFGKDFFVKNLSLSVDGTCFDYHFPKYDITLENIQLNLLGKHQATNAAMALTAYFLYMIGKLKTKKANLSSEAIYKAIKSVNWQGRMQVLSSKPLVIIDGAHNEEGISTLVKNIKAMFPDHKYHFLVAILRDKKLDKMIKEICTVAEDIYITKNPSDRAADIQEQVDVAVKCGTKYYADDDIVMATKKCLSSLQSEQDMMVITGSLYTIAEILKIKDELF